MVFSSLMFLFFFIPAFLFIYFIFKKRNIRNYILLIFSLLFYAWGEPIYIVLILFSIFINYYLAIFIDKCKNKKLYLILDLIFNIGVLVIFKYSNFFIDGLNNIFNIHIQLRHIPLPIVISFFTFQNFYYFIN